MKNIMKLVLALVVVAGFGTAVAEPSGTGGGVLKSCSTCRR
jgi:hypothetical protein